MTSLDNGTAYTFQVRAVNANGGGPAATSNDATPHDPDREVISISGPTTRTEGINSVIRFKITRTDDTRGNPIYQLQWEQRARRLRRAAGR